MNQCLSNQGFSKEQRLLKSSEFKRVFDRPYLRFSERHFTVLAIKNEFSFSRLGLVVSKKNIRLAAQRNRMKRAIRESFRTQAIQGMDTVVLVKRNAEKCPNADIFHQIQKIWQKLSVKNSQ